MNKILKVQVNKQIGDHKPGTIINVDADKLGTPLNLIWRRRLKDAETDQCCEIVKPKTKSKSQGNHQESE